MFNRILLPIDLQETQLAAKATKVAIDEARKHGADVHVMTVIPGFGMPVIESFFPDNAMKKAMKEVGTELKRYLAANFPPDISVHPIIGQGNPAEKILAECNEIKADLIIIPSHTRNLGEVFLGSCATRVVEHANCSVMVVKR